MRHRGLVAMVVALLSALVVGLLVDAGTRVSAADTLVQPDGSRAALAQVLSAPEVLYRPSDDVPAAPTPPEPEPEPAPAVDEEVPPEPDAAAARFASRFPEQVAARPVADDRWALLIGINTHLGGVADNHASRQDAERLWQLLRRAGWPEDRIVLLTDTDATGEMIRASLGWLADKSAPDATVVFHYSGHSKKWYGAGGRIDDQALWPTDDDFVRRDELGAALAGVEHAQLWGNVAACEAAGFHVDGVAAPGRVWTYSSRADQKSYEDPAHGHSVWGRFLLHEGLWQAGERPPAVQDAFLQASADAAHYTSLQRPHGPQVPVLHDDLGRPFALHPDG